MAINSFPIDTTTVDVASLQENVVLSEQYKNEAQEAASATPYVKPLSVLFLGQSNGKIDYPEEDHGNSVVDGVYVWDGSGLDGQDSYTGTTWLTGSDTEVCVNGMMYQVAKELRNKLRREVYITRVAKGSHSAVAFLKDTDRISGGWVLPEDHEDLGSILETQLPACTSAMPYGFEQFDLIIYQQAEADRGSYGRWVSQVGVFFRSLKEDGWLKEGTTEIQMGGMTDYSTNRYQTIDHMCAVEVLKGTWTDDPIQSGLMSFVSGTRTDTDEGDRIHFSPLGMAEMGARHASTYIGGETPVFPLSYEQTSLDLSISDAETGGNIAPASTSASLAEVRREVIHDERGRFLALGGYVDLSARWSGADTTGLSGNIFFTGLGLKTASEGSLNYRCYATPYLKGVTFSDMAVIRNLTFSPNSLGIYEVNSNGTPVRMTAGRFGSDVDVEFSIRYKVEPNGYILQGNKMTNGDFENDSGWVEGTGWSISGNLATHTAGSTDSLSTATNTPTLDASRIHRVEVTISGHTAGSLQVSFVGDTTVVRDLGSTDGLFHATVYPPDNMTSLEINPSSDFSGSISSIELYSQ